MRKAMDSSVTARITPQALAIAAMAHITMIQVSAAKNSIVRQGYAAMAFTTQTLVLLLLDQQAV